MIPRKVDGQHPMQAPAIEASCSYRHWLEAARYNATLQAVTHQKTAVAAHSHGTSCAQNFRAPFGMKILIIEDDRVAAKLFGTWLANAGYEVEFATDGP